MRTFNYKAQVFYTDGTSSAVQTPLPNITLLEVGEAIQLPSGFQALGLHLLAPEKTADYYECWLINGNGLVITTKRRYYLRDKDHHEVDLWFQNSLGVVECIALRTGFAHGIEVNKDVFAKGLPFNTDNTKHQVAAGDAQFTENFEVSTGYQSKTDLLPYIDILISKNVWWKDQGKLIPVVIDKGSYKIVERNEQQGIYAYALNFSFVKAYSQTSFSNTND
jgi:hypothetical protein